MSARKEIFANKLLELAYESTPNYGGRDRQRGEISSLVSVTPEISHYQDDILNRKKIKQAFAAANNSALNVPGGNLWFAEIDKIFWLGWARKLNQAQAPQIVSNFLDRRGKPNVNLAEFSCVGYIEGIDSINPDELRVSSLIGFIINGDVRYAVRGDAWSNERSGAHPFVKNWYKEKGLELPIRPAADPAHSLVNNVVLSPEDLDGNNYIGEIIIKNWEIEGIVVNASKYFEMLDIMPAWKQTRIWLESLPTLYPEYKVIYI